MAFKSELFEFLTPVEVSDGRFFVNDLFQRKFDSDAPDYPNHLVLFYNKNGNYIPASYLHFCPYKNVLLVGGGMTDGQAIKQMSAPEREAIARNDGLLYLMLRYGFEHFADRCDAYFGHVDDPRAYEIDIKAGFEDTEHEFLVAHYHKPIPNWKKKRLVKMVHRAGNF